MFAFHSSSALFFLPVLSSRTTITASQRARDQKQNQTRRSFVTNAQKSEQQQQVIYNTATGVNYEIFIPFNDEEEFDR